MNLEFKINVKNIRSKRTKSQKREENVHLVLALKTSVSLLKTRFFFWFLERGNKKIISQVSLSDLN